jgi:tRNA-splicing endonuclease subunit Sen34
VELRRWDAERKAAIQLQAGKETTTEIVKKSRALTGAAIQKRKEREEKRSRLNAMAAAATDGLSAGPSHLTEVVEALPSSSTSEHAQPHSVVVPTESSFEWYRPDECTFSTVESAKAAGIWSFPTTLHEKARCAVFRDLWVQGYFMGSGIKFGGDYLVYPG